MPLRACETGEAMHQENCCTIHAYIINKEVLMTRKFFLPACLIAFIVSLTSYQAVLAHESITIGDYTVEIGWLSEPPIVGQQNAIVVNVSTTSDGGPVEDVSALTVTVSYGGQSKTLTLQPLGEDTPGQFIAPILPTVPGQYTIILGGKLGDTDVSANVDPEEVQPADTLQFPNAQPTGQSSGVTEWLIYLSLLIGLIGVGLGMTALRKAR
jgi:hypothetical protein